MRLMACLGAGEAFGGATYREPNLPLAAQFFMQFRRICTKNRHASIPKAPLMHAFRGYFYKDFGNLCPDIR